MLPAMHNSGFQNVTPTSISQETKAQFDALLKVALKKAKVKENDDEVKEIDDSARIEINNPNQNRIKKLLPRTNRSIFTVSSSSEKTQRPKMPPKPRIPVPLPRDKSKTNAVITASPNNSIKNVLTPEKNQQSQNSRILKRQTKQEINSNLDEILVVSEEVIIDEVFEFERKKSDSSIGTYCVENPNSERSSITSDGTYNVNNKFNKDKKSNSETSSHNTYSISRGDTQESLKDISPPQEQEQPQVGDILIHNSPLSSSSSSIPIIDDQKQPISPKIQQIQTKTLNLNIESSNISSDEHQDDEDVASSDNKNVVSNLLTEKSFDVIPEILSTTREILNIIDYTVLGKKAVPSLSTTSRSSTERSLSNKNIPSVSGASNQSKRTTPDKVAYKSSDEKSSRTSTESRAIEPIPAENFSYENIVGIEIHKSDLMELHTHCLHPMVKVHLIDLETEKYLKKSDPKRAICYYYENKSVDFITPMITKEFNFQEQRSILPQWEETLLFNEDFNYFLNKRKVIIFFEIIDYLSFSSASQRFKSEGSNSGWHKIAWAFLKVIGKNGEANIENKVRLQLYKPIKLPKISQRDKCDVYELWKSKNLHKYTASLYVTVRKVGFISVKGNGKVLRSRNAIDQEYEILTALRFSNDNETNRFSSDITTPHSNFINTEAGISLNRETNWSRLPSQSCKPPNTMLHKFSGTSKGCFMLKFSNNGFWIACAVIDNANLFQIKIYDVLKGEKYCSLRGHQGLIYSLDWSFDDKYLLSASADCTVFIWAMNRNQPSAIDLIPHPAFVYCAQFLPKETNYILVVTGCYDNVLRVWLKYPRKADFTYQDNTYELLQEVEDHDDFITSICFDKSGEHLYSADNSGRIFQWEIKNKNLISKKKYKIRELNQITINTIICHPQGLRLLIYGRDGDIRLLNVVTGLIMQWFNQSSTGVQTRCCISPCGNLIFAPADEGIVNVWSTDTGHLKASYNLKTVLKTGKNVHCVQYHPHDHIVAFCHYGTYSSVFLFKYNQTSEKADFLTTFESKRETEKTAESSDDFHKIKPLSNSETLKPNQMSPKLVKPTLENIIEKLDRVKNLYT